MSSTSSRSINVSILVRSFSETRVVFLAPAPPSVSLAACSLCCQQKNAAAPPSCSPRESTARTPLGADGEALGEVRGGAARARRQGRPLDVMPLQVVAGFFESDRGRRASGVCGMNGIEDLAVRFTREMS